MRYPTHTSLFLNLLCILGLSLSSCVKEVFDDIDKVSNLNGVQSEIGYTVPVLDAEIGIKSLYENFSDNALVKLESDESFTFVYSSRDSVANRQLIKFDPTNSPANVITIDAASATLFNTVGSFSYSINNIAVIPTPGGEKLKQIFIKKGALEFPISCDILHHTQLVMYYPTITRNGKPLVDTIDLNYTGTAPIVKTAVISLDDCVIDLTDGGISYNVLPFLVQLNIEKVDGNPAVADGDKLTISNSLTINEYRGINGYVGKISIVKINEVKPIDMFENQLDVSVKLRDPRLRFSISNGYGTPVTIKIFNISLINTDGTEFPITINLFKDTFSLPAPSAVGDYAFGTYVIDRNNSNIDQLINNSLQNAPQAVKYNVELFTNYAGVEVDNFLFDTSSLKVDVGMEIPLDIQVSNFKMDFPFEFKLPADTGKNLDALIREVSLHTSTTNNLPLNTRLQIFFAKSRPNQIIDSFDIVDSLFANGLTLTHATIDSITGQVIDAPSVLSEGKLDRDKLLRVRDMYKADRLVLRVAFETSRDVSNKQHFVKVFNNQSIRFKVGVSAKGTVKQKF